MQKIAPIDVPSTQITVTNTATALYTLMDTAGSKKAGTNRFYYTNAGANSLMITPENGDIRMLFGADPTATSGALLKSGVRQSIPNTDLTDLRFIRVSGDVICSVEPYKAQVGESPYAVTPLGATVTGTPKFAFANIAASQTASSLVAAVTGKKIRVLSVYAVAGGTATNLTFNSASSAISALFANAANGGEVLPFSPIGWFETVAAEALTVTTGAGSTTGIGVVYVEV